MEVVTAVATSARTETNEEVDAETDELGAIVLITKRGSSRVARRMQ
jgi:hypothetical protein